MFNRQTKVMASDYIDVEMEVGIDVVADWLEKATAEEISELAERTKHCKTIDRKLFANQTVDLYERIMLMHEDKMSPSVSLDLRQLGVEIGAFPH